MGSNLGVIGKKENDTHEKKNIDIILLKEGSGEKR